MEKSPDLVALLTIIDWARRTINLPDRLTPCICSNGGALKNKFRVITTELILGESLREQGFMGLYTVGKGRMSLLFWLVDYNPTGHANAPVALCLVGKGITFDSGGYSLKPSDSMIAMKSDMGVL